jgi:hypothetical protein
VATLLVITVGGACAPVVTAIREYAPDYVGFLVSGGAHGSRVNVAGPGTPCGDARAARSPTESGADTGANILTQAGLAPERCEIIELAAPDSFSHCYARIHQALEDLGAARRGWRRIADYTGGTKTMSAALAAVALTQGWHLSLVSGTRRDLTQVLPDTEMATLVNAADVRARRRLAEARRLFDAYAYASAETLLTDTLRAAPLSSPELQREIQMRVTLCRAFAAWDVFDHGRARRLLAPYPARCAPQWRFLGHLTDPAPGYALALDLLRNAERCAARARYDDAVARLGRALELLAHGRLAARAPSLDADDLDPGPLRAHYAELRDPRRDTLALDLDPAYQALADLEDPLGALYRQWTPRVQEVMQARERSILGHGTRPVTQEQWAHVREIVADFIRHGLRELGVALRAPQFPTWAACEPAPSEEGGPLSFGLDEV